MTHSHAPLKPECSTGWFAAGKMMTLALQHLSDGAFKLFVHLCLQASRETGSLEIQQSGLARQLGKSRRSIGLYLAELEQKGCCSIETCRNQHARGKLTIAEAYWPYQRSQTEHSSNQQQAFVEEVKKLFLEVVPEVTSLTAADHRLACRWFSQRIPLPLLEKAFLLGSARKQVTRINRKGDPPIRSLHYFPPLLEEVRQLEVGENYWNHLRRQLQRLAQSPPARLPSSARNSRASQPQAEEQRPC
jgi:hypothetical protein